MWEGENSWNKSISLVDGKSDSYQLIISPCSDPISPLSSVGNGSPYSGGSMSPDTTSISSGSGEGGSIWGGSENGDCFSPADLFTTTGFFFGNGLASPSPDWCSSPGGALPSLHEWRKADLQRKYLHQQQQQLIQRFVFPDVTTPPSDGGRDELYNSSIGGDPVVTSSTPPSKDSPLNREITDNSGSVVPTSNKVVPPLTIGQRAVRFMKSFRSSTSSSSTCSTNKALSSEVISSTSLAEVNRHFDCMWIDCRGSFLQKDSLIEHIDRTHIQTRKEDFSCFWHGCVRRNRAFNARYKLLIHMRVHTGHKPNKCTVFGCDKAFSRLENLKIHLRSHTGERPYICPHCPKAFSNSSDRAKHQRTHFDSKPYACTYQDCVKRYTDPSSLRKHAKMHYLTGAGGVKASGKTVVGTSCKKDGQVKRNRRKYLGGGEGSDCKASVAASLPLPLSPAASLLPPIFEPKPEAQKCNAVSTFLNGNGDPQLNHFVSPPTSYFSTAEGPILCSPGIPLSPLIIKTEIESKESNAVGQTASNSDLDQIPLNDLDWISGVNFDDDFYFDYDL